MSMSSQCIFHLCLINIFSQILDVFFRFFDEFPHFCAFPFQQQLQNKIMSKFFRVVVALHLFNASILVKESQPEKTEFFSTDAKKKVALLSRLKYPSGWNTGKARPH